MKKSLFFTFLMITTFATAQAINDDLKNALKTDNTTALKKLINSENINNCHTIETSEYTILALAIKTNAKGCFTSLLAEKVNIEKACGDKTPLMYTAKYGRLDMAKALIKAGVKLRARNSKGRSALDYAKKYKQQEIMDYFTSFDQ